MIFTFQKSFFKFSKGKKWTNPDLKNKKFHPAIVAQQLSIDPGTKRSPVQFLQSGPLPVLQAQPPLGSMEEATNRWFSIIVDVSTSLSLCLPLWNQ